MSHKVIETKYENIFESLPVIGLHYMMTSSMRPLASRVDSDKERKQVKIRQFNSCIESNSFV